MRLSAIRAGIQTQAYATSVLVTVRKGLTKPETAGYTARSIVVHPATGRHRARASTEEQLSRPVDQDL